MYFLNSFENNVYMVIKRGSNGENTLYSTCMQHDMPQYLLVSFTPETPKFGRLGGVAHPH